MAINQNPDIRAQLQQRKRAREKRGKSTTIEPSSRGTFPRLIERRYERILLNNVNVAIKAIRETLIPALPAMVTEVGLDDSRQDTYVEDFEAIMAGIKVIFGNVVDDNKVERDAQDMTQAVDNQNEAIFTRQVKQVTGVTPFRSEPWLQATLTNSVSQNVSLIKTLHADLFKDIETVVLNGLERGKSTRELTKEIMKKTGASKSRARLIARDQVGKLNSNLASRRASDLGVKKFRWSTSQDERVRSSHRELNNKIFTYKDGATVDGESGVLPGQPIQCRCVAIPVISSISEE